MRLFSVILIFPLLNFYIFTPPGTLKSNIINEIIAHCFESFKKSFLSRQLNFGWISLPLEQQWQCQNFWNCFTLRKLSLLLLSNKRKLLFTKCLRQCRVVFNHRNVNLNVDWSLSLEMELCKVNFITYWEKRVVYGYVLVCGKAHVVLDRWVFSNWWMFRIRRIIDLAKMIL